MTVLVVFESMYGSTQAVARAVAEGLRRADGAGAVRVEEVGALRARGGELPADLTLLVVGGPTHAFGMSRAETRADALKEAPEGAVVSASGIRDWLTGLSLPADVPVAAFGTKVVHPHLPGSAAKGIEKALRRQGGRPVVKARSFGVNGKSEGLAEGELEAAAAWGEGLARAVAHA